MTYDTILESRGALYSGVISEETEELLILEMTDKDSKKDFTIRLPKLNVSLDTTLVHTDKKDIIIFNNLVVVFYRRKDDVYNTIFMYYIEDVEDIEDVEMGSILCNANMGLYADFKSWQLKDCFLTLFSDENRRNKTEIIGIDMYGKIYRKSNYEERVFCNKNMLGRSNGK